MSSAEFAPIWSFERTVSFDTAVALAAGYWVGENYAAPWRDPQARAPVADRARLFERAAGEALFGDFFDVVEHGQCVIDAIDFSGALDASDETADLPRYWPPRVDDAAVCEVANVVVDGLIALREWPRERIGSVSAAHLLSGARVSPNEAAPALSRRDVDADRAASGALWVAVHMVGEAICSSDVAAAEPAPGQREAGPVVSRDELLAWVAERINNAVASQVPADLRGPIVLTPEELLVLSDPGNAECPSELRIAIQAWQAVRRERERAARASRGSRLFANPHQALRAWLETNATALGIGGGAVDRIASVANWKKHAGASSS